MQVPTYITASDYEILAKHKPEAITVPQFMAHIIRNEARKLNDANKVE